MSVVYIYIHLIPVQLILIMNDSMIHIFIWKESMYVGILVPHPPHQPFSRKKFNKSHAEVLSNSSSRLSLPILKGSSQDCGVWFGWGSWNSDSCGHPVECLHHRLGFDEFGGGKFFATQLSSWKRGNSRTQGAERLVSQQEALELFRQQLLKHGTYLLLNNRQISKEEFTQALEAWGGFKSWKPWHVDVPSFFNHFSMLIHQKLYRLNGETAFKNLQNTPGCIWKLGMPVCPPKSQQWYPEKHQSQLYSTPQKHPKTSKITKIQSYAVMR